MSPPDAPIARKGYDPLPFPVKILLVDDNRANQLVAVGVLKRFGLKPTVASTGAEALELIRNEAFDICFMDCSMPEMDGYEATGLIRKMEAEEPARPRLPVIAVTAHSMRGDREKCLSAGMDDYIAKPLDKKAVREKILHYVKPPEEA